MVASFQAVMSNRGLCQFVSRVFAAAKIFLRKILLVKYYKINLIVIKFNNFYIYFLYQNFEEILQRDMI